MLASIVATVEKSPPSALLIKKLVSLLSLSVQVRDTEVGVVFVTDKLEGGVGASGNVVTVTVLESTSPP